MNHLLGVLAVLIKCWILSHQNALQPLLLLLAMDQYYTQWDRCVENLTSLRYLVETRHDTNNLYQGSQPVVK